MESFTRLMMEGRSHQQGERFESARKAYELAARALPEPQDNYRVFAKVREASVLLELERWDSALGIYDELLAAPKALIDYPSEQFPDDVASIYWGRAYCLGRLRRLHEADSAVTELVAALGGGHTPAQRGFLAAAFVLQAGIAELRGDLRRALSLADAATALTSAHGDGQQEVTSELEEALRDAERARRRLLCKLERS